MSANNRQEIHRLRQPLSDLGAQALDGNRQQDDGAQECLFVIDIHLQHGQAVSNHGQDQCAAEEANAGKITAVQADTADGTNCEGVQHPVRTRGRSCRTGSGAPQQGCHSRQNTGQDVAGDGHSIDTDTGQAGCGSIAAGGQDVTAKLGIAEEHRQHQHEDDQQRKQSGHGSKDLASAQIGEIRGKGVGIAVGQAQGNTIIDKGHCQGDDKAGQAQLDYQKTVDQTAQRTDEQRDDDRGNTAHPEILHTDTRRYTSQRADCANGQVHTADDRNHQLCACDKAVNGSRSGQVEKVKAGQEGIGTNREHQNQQNTCRNGTGIALQEEAGQEIAFLPTVSLYKYGFLITHEPYLLLRMVSPLNASIKQIILFVNSNVKLFLCTPPN